MDHYDTDNVFAKIINKKIPVKIIFEDAHTLAFPDLYPVAPIHILLVPKGKYVNYSDFINNASLQETMSFFKAISTIEKDLSLISFRLITNQGTMSGQSIFHFHMHIIAGKQLKELIPYD